METFDEEDEIIEGAQEKPEKEKPEKEKPEKEKPEKEKPEKKGKKSKKKGKKSKKKGKKSKKRSGKDDEYEDGPVLKAWHWFTGLFKKKKTSKRRR